ncbi:hypothetical protein CE91St41_26900 [Oscillospiraceae bacterium]|nr:hypothetical protein CE91St40_10640 [Oscillospiraceae bacterium]BDF75801.1 hypothetical protein CE91St41_26900 [Oscillospiraceae bacterium]
MSAPANRPAARRTRPTFWDGLVGLAVLACAAAIFMVLRPAPSNFLYAEIVLDNETVARYDLNALAGPFYLPVEGAAYPLIVEADHGRIRIAESACPGGDCLRTGWADRPGQQIICLPNRLVISLTGENGAADGIDAVTG